METLEQKLKQIKVVKAIGDGYPDGYKESINAYMSGINSGRFDSYKEKYFVKSRNEANELLRYYNNLIKQDLIGAKMMAVKNFFYWKNKLEEYMMLYGRDSEAYQVTELKMRVSEFVCISLPNVEEGEYE